MERSVLGVKLQDLNLTGIIDVKKTVRLKWGWAGNVNRMDCDRWVKITTLCEPADGRRRRERPRKRWRDDVYAYRARWFHLAQNSESWKDLGDLPSSGTEWAR